jgi:site-specific DNA recombinase
MIDTYIQPRSYIDGESLVNRPKFTLGIYIRVSGKSQAEDDKVSLPVQKKDLTELARENGWRVYRIYRDVLSGGLAFENRDEGRRLLKDAIEGKFNLVVVWDYDRLGRDREGKAAQDFRHEMRELGIQIYSLNQPLQLKDPDEYKEDPYSDDGQILMEKIQDWQSASTINRFRHRSIMGKTERAKSGKMLNTPPYGYRLEPLRDENGQIVIRKDKRIVYKRVINEDEKPNVIRIYKEYIFKGRSMNEIRDGLNADGISTRKGGHWERATIARILKNPVYYGALVYNKYYRRKNALTGKTKMGKNPTEKWIVVSPKQTEHEEIISKEWFDKVQEIIKKKLKLGPKSVYMDYLFSGLGKCGVCGNKMYRTKVRSFYTRKSDGVTTKSETNGYVCGRWQRFRDTGKNYISERDVKYAVLSDLEKLKGNPRVLEGFLSESNKKEVENATSNLEFLKSNLSKVDERYNRLLRAYEYGTLKMGKFKEATDKLEQEEKQMRRKVAEVEEEAKNERRREISRDDFKKAVNNFESIFIGGDIKAQKAFLRSLIDNIVVKNKLIKINYSL